MLRQLVEAVVRVAGASGAGFARLRPPARLPRDSGLVGRVVAASGTCDWLLGRPVTVARQTATAMSSGEFSGGTRIVGIAADAGRLCLCQPPERERRIDAGVFRTVLAPCVLNGSVTGAFLVCYPPAGPAPTREQRSIARLYATLTAGWYGSCLGSSSRWGRVIPPFPRTVRRWKSLHRGDKPSVENSGHGHQGVCRHPRGTLGQPG